MEIWELLLILLVGIQAFSVIEGHPGVTETDSPSDTAYLEVDRFLTTYGYYPSSGSPPAKMRNPGLRNRTDTERTKALKLFQKFYDLPQSGELGKETKQLMQKKRCGNADITPNPFTTDTSPGRQRNVGEDVGQTRKESKKQSRDESGINEETRGRRLDVSRKKRVKRRMSTPFKRGKLDRYRKRRMVWKIISFSKQKSLQGWGVQKELVKKAISVWKPILPFTFYESLWLTPVQMEIYFHSFSQSDQNKSNVTPRSLVRDRHRLPTAGDLDLHHSKCGWRKHEGTELETEELVRERDVWYMRSRRRWEAEQGLKRKWNREELDRHNSARRMNRTKIERPKNAPKRKGSHAHTMTTLNEDLPCYRDIHIDEDYDWSNHEELLSVLLHEMGHAWGLGHTSDERAVMYPYNRDSTQLAFSDIEGIERLYGSQDGRLRRHLCEARLREVDQILWTPTPNFSWDGWYFVFSGKKLQYLSVNPGENGIFRTYRLYEMIFPNAPSKYDVVFSHIGSNSVFFIAGNTVYEYFEYIPMPVRNYSRDDYLFETPKLSMAVSHHGRERVFLFGEKYKWSFEFTYTIQRPLRFALLGDQDRQRVKDVKFAVQWIDGLIYVVTRNGGWYSFDKNRTELMPGYKNRADLKPGYPPWMESYLCHGDVDDAESIGMSRPSLVLVIMLSLIKLY